MIQDIPELEFEEEEEEAVQNPLLDPSKKYENHEKAKAEKLGAENAARIEKGKAPIEPGVSDC